MVAATSCTAAGKFTDIPRRATVVNMISDGVKSDSDEKLLDPDIVVPKGNKMEGQFFPLLTNGAAS